MAGKWTGYFKFVTPSNGSTTMTDSQEMTDVGAYNNYTWYQRLIQGSASRMTRYREYDLMDNDIEVTRALDTISEEMIGNNTKTDEPLVMNLLAAENEDVDSGIILTVRTALKRWCEIHNFSNQLFNICRFTIKYGDVFFRRKNQFEKWQFVHPKNVVAAIVDENDVTKVKAWVVKSDITRPKSGAYGGLPIGAKQESQFDTQIVTSRDVIRFTLNEEMSDTAPFGESILRAVYRSHKQKELLEDAIIIYRVQRAPERRVFKIDVGKMPPQRIKQYLESIKNEIKQKKVPNFNGGQTEVDTVYNPQSMSEDFFFAQRPDGRGSSVETLPGGQNLGELTDLEYFQKKVWRGLRVPSSYMMEGQENQLFNDGKVGTAYIQELRFALFVMRLQSAIEQVLDDEFKNYLRLCNIHIDPSLYKIRLPEPSNFGKYRQFELDNSLLSSFANADNIQYFSKRFILKRFLQMSPEEIAENEYMLREERGVDKHGGTKDLPKLYGAQEGAMGGMGGMGGVGPGFGGAEAPMMPGEIGGAEGAGGEMPGGEGGATAGGPPGGGGVI